MRVKQRGPRRRMRGAAPALPAPPQWVWPLLVAVAGASAVFHADNPDLWFHLAAGRSIATHGLPVRETWCLAAYGDRPWLSEWLFHLPLYKVYALGGHVALALWRAAWAAAAMALALGLARSLGAASWSLALLAPLAVATARARQHARPDQLFLTLALLYVAVLERARRSGRDASLWLLPVQAVWANLHPSWVFGPLITLLYAVAGGAPARGAPPDPGAAARRGRRALLAAGLVAASALTPTPLETLVLPFRFLGEARGDPLTSSIEELRSWSWAADAGQPFTAWLAMGLGAAIVGSAGAWRASPPLALAAAAAMALGAVSFRFRALAALAALPALAVALEPRGRRRAAALGAAAAACAAGLAWLAWAPQFRPGVAPQWGSVPVRAVAVAESLRLRGPALNTFHYGGYILWARGESSPPFMDGRARGNARLRGLFARAGASSAALDSLAALWPFTHALLAPPRDLADRMAVELARQPQWRLVFADDAGLLFVRRDRFPAAAERLAYRLFTPDYSAMAELSTRALAESALRRDFVAELERARAESPWHARASLWLGLFRLASGDGPAALELLSEVERLAPATPGLALRLGYARRMVGDVKGARSAYRRALREPEDAAAAREALAR